MFWKFKAIKVYCGLAVACAMSWIIVVVLYKYTDAYAVDRHINVTKPKPNILLIIADDYGYNDVGYHGSEIKTPILDDLALNGVRLENYYVQPICTPSRADLLSGRYQIHTGLQHEIIWHSQPNGLPLDNPTIADKLREAGYSTHMIGKWHIGFYKKEYTPIHRGFDSFFGFLSGDIRYYSHITGHRNISGYDLREHEDTASNEKYYGRYATTLFMNKTIEVIEKHDISKPLFVYLPFSAVHTPLEVPAHYLKPYLHIKDLKRRTYAGMVACMDESIGNIVKVMKRRNIWENTILIFSTDNGANTDEGGSNLPLKGKKGDLWEGAIRAVGFIHSQLLNKNAIGTVSSALMHITDWFPTLVHVAGGKLNGTKTLDGYNQWKTINNGNKGPRTELLHFLDPITAKKGKGLFKNTFQTSNRSALRIGDWKVMTGWPSIYELVSKNQTRNVWLYNIAKDPKEMVDLSQQHPDIVQKMLKRLTFYERNSVSCNYPAFDENANPKLHGDFWGPWM